ncbi:MAG: integrase core domain-containing protein, partial [Candidatus Methanofastidiosia archaeon]
MPLAMTIISQSYVTLKRETGAEFARKVLLETHDYLGENVKATAQAMQCNRRTVYLALKKREKENLADVSHAPHHIPSKSSEELEGIIGKRRKETGFGKRRLRWYILELDKRLIPESTIGAILKRRKLARKKKRVRRQPQSWYAWENLLPFEECQLDTKEIADKDTLPQEVYNHFIRKPLPRWQWTFEDVVTKIRFLAWSYSRDWACGQVFVSLVVWWLRSFGFTNKINVRIDGGLEWQAIQRKAFERALQNFFHPLGIFPQVIRKGHPEDNNFVERSHETDDYEFYILYLLSIHNENQWVKRGAWWQKVYNLIRRHMGIGDLTPYQKLKSLGYTTPEAFCIFPTFILDHLAASKTVFTGPKSVQHPLDYD